VSTDDEEIAIIAEKHGAEVPFLRPASFAQDDTPDQPMLQHALDSLKQQNRYEPDIVLNLRPTTPLKTPQTIDKVVEKIEETKADIVRTMTQVEGVYHPYWMYTMSPDSLVVPFLDDINISDYHQRQLLPQVYRINGVVDAYMKNTVTTGNILESVNMCGLIIPEEESIDIDTEFDFYMCELFLRKALSIE
jgi:CMP-N-acetylneuraminic acid synthetase